MVEILSLEVLAAMAGSFLATMVTKGLVEPVAERSWNAAAGAVMDCLPMLFALTDPFVGRWIADGEDVEEKARSIYEQATGRRLPAGALEQWRQRFDPARAANPYEP